MKHTTECPAERAIYFLGGKWKIRIVFLLYQNKKIRFGELKKILQTVTQQMLSKQLKELEIDGLINRKVHQVVPPKVEYSLTEFGSSLIPILRSFSDWNKKNSRTISLKLNKNFEENRIR
jgi:DNA-binding HxlR family transcriptional regulator